VQILADGVGIPCKLVKGSNYTGGDDDDAINIIKMDHERYLCFDHCPLLVAWFMDT